MPHFGKRSLAILEDVDPEVVAVLTEAIKIVDFSVTRGHCTTEEQQALWAQGRTMPGAIVTYCDGVEKPSKHQSLPSIAVDIAPWGQGGIDWRDKPAFYYVIGVIMGVASQMGVKLRAGLDFNMDGDLKNDRFVDAPHLERVD